MEREVSHPASVDPDVADGETIPIPPTPGHPELDGRARTAGQTWIGWRVQLQPGEVAAGGDAGVRSRSLDEDRAARDDARRRLRRDRPRPARAATPRARAVPDEPGGR